MYLIHEIVKKRIKKILTVGGQPAEAMLELCMEKLGYIYGAEYKMMYKVARDKNKKCCISETIRHRVLW